ncbi:MAG: XRE family transcriptional regulator [Trueperaceae bacterium]|nr:XRE family transcriptional regulator [Trueperaceae bacterium]
MKIGSRIRQLRTDQRLSLEALAERSGCSRSMLSEIERDAKSPTLRTLSQLASGLGVSISELVAEEAREPTVDRQAERTVERDPETGVEFEVLAPDWRTEGVGILLVRLPRGQSTGPLSPHPLGMREHVYVLAGNLEARTDDHACTLGPGDAMSVEAKQNHEMRASGEEGCTFLVTTKGPRPEFLRYRSFL